MNRNASLKGISRQSLRKKADAEFTLPEISTADQARDAAIEWQHWVGEQNLSYGEMGYWDDVFADLASQFGLEEEFQENGIIGTASRKTADIALGDEVHDKATDDMNTTLPVVTVEHSDKDTENLGWIDTAAGKRTWTGSAEDFKLMAALLDRKTAEVEVCDECGRKSNSGAGPHTDGCSKRKGNQPSPFTKKEADIAWGDEIHDKATEDMNTSLPVVTPENEDDATEDFGWTTDQAVPDLGSDRLLQSDKATASKNASNQSGGSWSHTSALSNASYTEDDTDLFG